MVHPTSVHRKMNSYIHHQGKSNQTNKNLGTVFWRIYCIIVFQSFVSYERVSLDYNIKYSSVYGYKNNFFTNMPIFVKVYK